MKIGVRFGCASKRATLQDAKGPYAGSVGEQLRTSPTSKSSRCVLNINLSNPAISYWAQRLALVPPRLSDKRFPPKVHCDRPSFCQSVTTDADAILDYRQLLDTHSYG